MNVKPPKLAEAIVRWLLPSACVEHVLGDLQERMQAAEPTAAGRQYILEALVTVPSVIFGQIRRSLDFRLVLLYVAIQYAAFVGAALLERYAHGVQVTAGSLAIFWFITLVVVLLKLTRTVGRPLSWLANLVFYIALFIYAFVPSEYRFLNALGSGALIGDGFLDFARKRFEKHFSGPRGRMSS
jgi:hypothetical protein